MTTATNSTTEPRFNLTVEPWIPVVWRDGRRTPERVSLRDAFALGTEILDLAGGPHERVALLRLLICVAQAALNGPPTRAAWGKLGPPQDATFSDLKAKVAAYLALHDQTHPDGKFWLFHPTYPFLQVAGLSAPPQKKTKGHKDESSEVEDEEGPVRAEKNVELLELRCARDNTSTLFDQSGGTGRHFSDAELVVMLLTYLNFAPGQPEGLALWNGNETLSKGGKPAKGGKCYAAECPCTVESAVHAFVQGHCLLETVHLNLVPANELKGLGFDDATLGQPVWEIGTAALREQTKQSAPLTSYLQRLVPLSRLAKLNPNRQTMILTNGVEYSPFLYDAQGKRTGIHIRPPSTAFFALKKKGQETTVDKFVSAEPGKSFWRVLHLLALLRDTEHGGKRPIALVNLEDRAQRQPLSRIRLLAVAMLRNPRSKAKLEDVVESVFEVRAGLMCDESAFNDYQEGLEHAGEEAERLEKAAKTYFTALQEQQRLGDLKRAALQDFWNALEQDAPTLLSLLDANLGENGRYASGQIDFTSPQNLWGQCVRAAALAAYRRACPCLNARQIIAHAEGLRAFDRKPSKPTKKHEHDS
jgi:CRISPR system Cascade subunit CasA